jgi:glycosyltransferase involved in cell wall biosynthesis
MNIALLHYSCPPVVGGVEEIVRQQASLFQLYGNSVKVFAGAGASSELDCPVEIEPLLGSRDPRVLAVHEGLPFSTADVKMLANEIFAYLDRALQDFDVLIAHNVLSMHYNLPLTQALHKVADWGCSRVVSWSHDSSFFSEHLAGRLSSEQWRILKNYNPSIHYVTITDSRRNEFQALMGDGADFDVIPNGIDPIHFFGLDPGTIRLIREERLFESDCLMVQPARLHRRKNIELSIRVIRALQDQGLRAHLILTGAHDPHEKTTLEYYRELKSLAAELKVESDILTMAKPFHDCCEERAVDRKTIRDLYLIADLLFMPSWQEGFGIPLLEAGVFKLPIFCSDIAPFREVGGHDVHFFSPGDPPEAIARRIAHITDSLPCHRMFRNVIRNYAWDNIYHDKLLPLLRDVVYSQPGLPAAIA